MAGSTAVADAARDHGAMPVTEVLAALREEIGDLARTSGEIETLLADLAAQVRPEIVAEVVSDVQAIDAMRQRLEALEIYLQALRGLVPSHWELDPRPASALLTLSQVASRLTRATHEPEHDAGDCELF